jgi:hypothetical protein
MIARVILVEQKTDSTEAPHIIAALNCFGWREHLFCEASA